MKKCIKVYIVRHGETVMNRQGITAGTRPTPLTPKGRKQAEKAAKILKRTILTAAYSSPIFRTRQTARIICKNRNIKIINSPIFKERKYGILVGRTGKQIVKMIPDIKEQWTRDGIDWKPCKNSESIRDIYLRAIAGFNGLIKKHKAGDSILVVTHGCMIKCLLLYFSKKGPEKYFKIAPVTHCSVTEIIWENQLVKLRCLLK